MNVSDLVFFTDTGRDPVRLSDRRPARVVLNAAPPAEPSPGDLARFSVVFATQETFDYRYARWNKDDRLEIRWMRARLDLSPGKVRASVDSLAGVPVAWAHDIGGWSLFGTPTGAVGRVQSMGIRGGQLVGEMLVSGRELSVHMAGGIPDLESGINAGISIGFQQLTEPKLSRGEGTRAKPDRMTFGQIRVLEASLTPIPQLKGAGIKGRLAWPVESEKAA